jgi:hypothetical protein
MLPFSGWRNQLLPYVGFLLGLLFDPEEGGIIWLWKSICFQEGEEPYILCDGILHYHRQHWVLIVLYRLQLSLRIHFRQNLHTGRNEITRPLWAEEQRQDESSWQRTGLYRSDWQSLNGSRVVRCHRGHSFSRILRITSIDVPIELNEYQNMGEGVCGVGVPSTE